MVDDLVDDLRVRLPALFAQAATELERRAAEGDASARRRLDELAQADAAAFLRVSGGGELTFVNRGLALAELGHDPGGAFGHALELPAAALREGVSLLAAGGPPLEQFARAWAALVSTAARGLFATASYGFELVVTSVPGLGELRAKIALGQASLPAAPEFTLTVDYEQLEDAREQQLSPQQLFLAGKVQVDGDVAKAMMLGMTLAQLR